MQSAIYSKNNNEVFVFDIFLVLFMHSVMHASLKYHKWHICSKLSYNLVALYYEVKQPQELTSVPFHTLVVCSGLGLVVLLDIVHSYASADELVGLSLFDGSNDCYFHSGT